MSARILAARLVHGTDFFDRRVRVLVVTETQPTEEELFAYYPDELTFTAEEFVGKTVAEAVRMHFDRDRTWLLS